MFKSIGNVLSKGVELVGDFIPGIGDARAQEKANEQNKALYYDQKDWQQNLANTAYQRAMDDMKKAGLNPMLAYQQGGASVPSVATPTMEAAPKTAGTHAALKAFTGIEGAKAQVMNAQTAQAQAQSSIQLQGAQTAQTVAETQHTVADTKLKERELRGKGVKETIDREGGRIIQNILDSLKRNSAKPDTTRLPHHPPYGKKKLVPPLH